MASDANGLEILDREECFALLKREHLGRVGVTMDALPAILPVDFAVVDDKIAFRTVPGTKLSAAAHNAVVAFEVDHEDVDAAERWSVLVVGTCHPMTVDEIDGAAWRVGHLGPWIDRPDTRPVAINADVVTGRRLRLSSYDRSRALRRPTGALARSV